jgi:hypothetical protein
MLFSPDGDGINDVLVWGLDCAIIDNTVQIFNRWGVEAFNTTAYGTINNHFRGISQKVERLFQVEKSYLS